MEKKSSSWLGCFGLALVIIFALSMYGCEAMNLAELQVFEQVQESIVPMPDNTKIDKKFDGKTVYTQGKITGSDVIEHELLKMKTHGLVFGFSEKYYQYEQRTKRRRAFSAENRYKYLPEWKFDPEDSKRFAIPQDNTLIYSKLNFENIYAPNVMLGAYKVGHSIINALPRDKLRSTKIKPNLTPEALQAIHDDILAEAKKNNTFSESVRAYYADIDNGKKPGLLVHIVDDMLYLGRDVNNPLIGDTMIRFFVIEESTDTFSFIVKVNGNTLEEFEDSSGFSGYSMLEIGDVSLQKMLYDNADFMVSFRWVAVAIHFVLLFIAVFMLFYSKSDKDKFTLPFFSTVFVSIVMLFLARLTIWLW